MQKQLLLIALLTCVTTCDALSADDVRAELVKAINSLDQATSYSWSTTVKVPEGTRFAPGPSTGRRLKNGELYATTTRGQTTTEIVKVDGKSAVTNQQGEWQSLAEVEAGGGFGRFTANMVRDLNPPTRDALELTEGIAEISKVGDLYTGQLTEKAATELAAAASGFRRGGASNVVFVKATVSFQVNDGMLTKMEQALDASMDFNGTEFVVERITTTAIENVGNTTFKIPEDAKAKMK